MTAARVREALAARDVTVIANPDYAEGLSTSIRAGLNHLPQDIDGAIFILGDMPRVTAAHIDRLIAAFNPAEGRGICVPTHRAKRGNPVLWSARYFAAMQALEGDTGARGLLGEHADQVCEVEMPDDGVLLDIDTPDALAGIADRRRQGLRMSFDLAGMRAQFPILTRRIGDAPLHYLDNAATAQVPEAVLDAMRRFETTARANVLRGVHQLAEEATAAYAAARGSVARYLNVAADEVVFTGGTTAAINLVAHSFGDMLKPGDEVVISELEHHSNIVPWQMLRDRRGIVLKALPVTTRRLSRPDGALDRVGDAAAAG